MTPILGSTVEAPAAPPTIPVVRTGVLKRLIDVSASLVVLALFAPVGVLVALAIRVTSPGPIFFRQKRVGRGLRTFDVLKFRTMTHVDRSVPQGPLIGKAEGVTPVGYWLRRLKIDELPQVLHVLRGEMSLVGPRPSVPSQLADTSWEDQHRYSVRPGITGLAQVSGSIHLPWPERFKYDLYYVRRRTFWLDVRIMVRTIFVIVRGEAFFVNRPLVDLSVEDNPDA
jgi:undecaprenyl phosphate N,N'-diacetylbacillosamine 1-phosphate transferase